MEWQDDGIVVARRKHGESSLICSLLTREHGLHRGLARGGAGRRMRASYEIGNRLRVVWRARLAEHLGIWRGEIEKPHAAVLLNRPQPLMALGAAAGLVAATLPEREPNAGIFHAFAALLEALPGAGWRAAYGRFEAELLARLGYGLDLETCAVTGVSEGLVFVSPRTGRAVSRVAAAPYKGRLLALPRFLIDPRTLPDAAEFLAGLRLTGHFFEHRVLRPADRRMPQARDILYDMFLRRVRTSTDEDVGDRDG